MKPTTIFLDVDEVLADWLSAMLALYDWDKNYAQQLWAKHTPRPWDVFSVLPVLPSLAWRRIDEAGAEFWADLEPLPWMRDLVALCQSYAPTTLLTSPSSHPSSYAGKAAWINQHFGNDFPHLIGRAKSKCAHPRSLLIDDSPRNCESFQAAGGDAIVFPGLGNQHHAIAADPMPFVRDLLRLRFG